MAQALKHSLVPALVALALAPSAFATTANSGSMNLQARVTVTATTSTDPASQSWTSTPATLNASVSTSASDANGVPDTANATASASWASADSGSVTFTNYGWAMNTFGQAWLDGVTDWSYTFTTSGAGTFTMNYNVTAAGQPFGLWGWSIYSSDGNDLVVSNATDPTTSGTYTDALSANQTYTISLVNNANISGSGSTGSMNGEFDWNIATTSVPEPGNLALLVAGLALVGTAARRRAR